MKEFARKAVSEEETFETWGTRKRWPYGDLLKKKNFKRKSQQMHRPGYKNK